MIDNVDDREGETERETCDDTAGVADPVTVDAPDGLDDGGALCVVVPLSVDEAVGRLTETNEEEVADTNWERLGESWDDTIGEATCDDELDAVGR